MPGDRDAAVEETDNRLLPHGLGQAAVPRPVGRKRRQAERLRRKRTLGPLLQDGVCEHIKNVCDLVKKLSVFLEVEDSTPVSTAIQRRRVALRTSQLTMPASNSRYPSLYLKSRRKAVDGGSPARRDPTSGPPPPWQCGALKLNNGETGPKVPARKTARKGLSRAALGKADCQWEEGSADGFAGISDFEATKGPPWVGGNGPHGFTCVAAIACAPLPVLRFRRRSASMAAR